MKKIRFIICSIFLIAVVSLSIGCATLPSPDKMAMEVTGYELPTQVEADSAMVYIVRPSSLGFVIRFNIFLDDKEADSEMGYTRGSQYIYFYVSPGKHTILSKAENWAEATIDTKPGDIVFLKQETSMGVIMARNSLKQIDEIEGKYHVKNTKPGTIIKTRK